MHSQKHDKPPAAKQSEILRRLQAATAAHQGGDLEAAGALYREVLALDPHNADAHHLLGVIAYQQQSYAQALEHIQQAIALNPRAAVFHNNLGNIYKDGHHYDEAMQCYREALRLNPELAEAQNNVGNVLTAQDRAEEALPYYETALRINPGYVEAMLNMANALSTAGRYAQSLQAGMGLLERGVVHADVYNNLSIALKEQGHIEEALEVIEEGLRLNPEHPELHWNRAITRLLAGDLRRGWEDYRWGALIPRPIRLRPALDVPVWNGSDLRGKTILVHGEQGVGDEIMFASCLPALLEQGAECILACEPRLAPLFARSFACGEVHAGYEQTRLENLCAQHEIDVCAALGDLPVHLRDRLSRFPDAPSYLCADPTKLERWKERYRNLGPGIKIGLSWRGGHRAAARALRSTTLAQWQELLQTPHCRFINLQYGDCARELQALHAEKGILIHDWEDADPLSDMDDFAAQIAALDLVIAIDNSTVHLAGALGVPTWTLLPRIADWRWFLGRTDTPWYSSMRLFRQDKPGEWAPVFQHLQALLHEAVNRHTDIGELTHRPEPPVSAQPGTALLINDTRAWYHWGCTCTSTALHQHIEARGLRLHTLPIDKIHACKPAPRDLEDFDDEGFYQRFKFANAALVQTLHESEVVIVNGEGSLHGLEDIALKLLYLAHIAKTRAGRPVHIINHSCYPQDTPGIAEEAAKGLYLKVYCNLDSIAVREQTSAALLSDWGLTVTPSFDCLPLYLERSYTPPPRKPTRCIVIAGSVAWSQSAIEPLAGLIKHLHTRGYKVKILTGAQAFPARDDTAFVEALSACDNAHWQPIDAVSVEQWLDCIAQADLLISGRFHHSIAAAFLGTPLIALNSNTPKMSALMHMLGLPEPIAYTLPSLEQALLSRAEALLNNPEPGRVSASRLDSLRELSLQNFQAIHAAVPTANPEPDEENDMQRHLDQTAHGVLIFEQGERDIERSLLHYGEYAIALRELFEQILKPGDHVVHAGADIGVISLELARRVGDSGHMLACEPHRQRFPLLCANLALNGYDNTDFRQCALGAQTQLSPALDTQQILRIDDLGLTRCDLIQSDTASQDILSGAGETLQRHKPFLCLKQDAQTVALIEQLNYDANLVSLDLFNPRNSKENEKNIFGDATLHYVLGVPRPD